MTTKPSDTPETDAECWLDNNKEEFVYADFARRLESARDEAVELLKLWLMRLDYSDPYGDAVKVRAFLVDQLNKEKP